MKETRFSVMCYFMVICWAKGLRHFEIL